MFELSSGDRRRAPHRSGIPVLIATAAHVGVVSVLLAIPILYVSAEVPEAPAMMAFAVSAPPRTRGSRRSQGSSRGATR
jgi:hypothetical protein